MFEVGSHILSTVSLSIGRDGPMFEVGSHILSTVSLSIGRDGQREVYV